VIRPAAILAIVGVLLAGAAHGVEISRDDDTRPIIAQLLSDPAAYAGKPVTIYGLVIEQSTNSEFLLQDVSQRPLRIVGTNGVHGAVGDELILHGVLAGDRRNPYFLARSSTKTKVLGGGGCC
jgi:hypothetical protein